MYFIELCGEDGLPISINVSKIAELVADVDGLCLILVGDIHPVWLKLTNSYEEVVDKLESLFLR